MKPNRDKLQPARFGVFVFSQQRQAQIKTAASLQTENVACNKKKYADLQLFPSRLRLTDREQNNNNN